MKPGDVAGLGLGFLVDRVRRRTAEREDGGLAGAGARDSAGSRGFASPATATAAGTGPATDAFPRRKLLGLTLGALVLCVLLMVPFEATVTRVLGVLALFTFVIAGVFLIADPAFLDQDED